MITKKQILTFITTIRESFTGSDIVYTKGSCYQFYKVLKIVFPTAEAYYDSNHVITKIGKYYYDITGEVKKHRHLKVDIHYYDSGLEKLGFIMFIDRAALGFKEVSNRKVINCITKDINVLYLQKVINADRIDKSKLSYKLAEFYHGNKKK